MPLTIILSLFLFIFSVYAASAEDWRSRSIYQLVTDRFALSNDSALDCNTADRLYCGGSWVGIINHLDYIQELGCDAVWISPVVENVDGIANESLIGQPYHGYWTRDLQSINTNFGTIDDLKNLSSALHQRGMYLMFDVVVNHVASTKPHGDTNWTYYSPFSSENLYHPFCWATQDNNQTNLEQCWLGDDNLPLPDIDTENPAVVQTLYSWIQELVQDYNVDGLRIDTVKHIRQDFWPGFSESAGVYTVGEVLTNDVAYASPYTRVIDAVLDYPVYYNLTAAFASPQGDLSALQAAALEEQASYKNGAFSTGSFLENQDQPRFQALTKDQALVKNAMMWPYIYDGVPILYYGQEQGYQGDGDPSNREALWLSGFDTDKPLFQHVKTLNAVRKVAITANESYLSTPMKFVSTEGNSTLVVSRPPLLALFTNAGSNGSGPTNWTVPNAGFKKNDTLVDVLSCQTFQADGNGGINIEAFYGDPRMLIPASQLNKTGPLCPDVATGDYVKNSAPAAQRISWSLYAVLLLVISTFIF